MSADYGKSIMMQRMIDAGIKPSVHVIDLRGVVSSDFNHQSTFDPNRNNYSKSNEASDGKASGKR